jgi:hypothetical protein
MTHAQRIDPSDERDVARTPELTLWRAVIDQHLRDAVSNSVSEKRIRREAREWFATRGTTFRYVCSLAGYDPDWLADRATILFDKADRGERNPSPISTSVRRAAVYHHDGKSLTLAQWSEATGMDIKRLRSRVQFLGWPIGRALSEPLDEKRSRRIRRITPHPGAGPMFQQEPKDRLAPPVQGSEQLEFSRND